MQLKFLFGSTRALPLDDGDETLKDVLVMTRKTDIFQHSDMRQVAAIGASTGGFVRKFHKLEKMDFYGESISCRVRTDESMLPVYAAIMEKGTWWKHEHLIHNKVHTIFAVTVEGYKLSPMMSGITWTPSSHADMYDTVKAEDEAANGW